MLFNVYWRKTEYGKSQHEAESREELYTIDEEQGLIEDFGDSDVFEENYECEGWEIDYIEEIT